MTDENETPTARDVDTVGEGAYLIGETEGTSPGDNGYVWEEFAIDSDQEFGVETTDSSTLSDDARRGAKRAISEGKVSEAILEKSTTSQQGDEEARDRTLLSNNARSYIQPPYDPTALANLAQKSGTHARCVHAKAQGVAAYGFALTPHPRHADTNNDGVVDDAEAPEGMDSVREFWFDRSSRFQLGPNRQSATPEEVLTNVWWDYEGVGWGCLEFLVNRTGDPTGLAHVPAHRIRKRVDAPGYVELDTHGQIKQYYSEAGLRYDTSADGEENDQTFVDRWTGETSSTRSGVSDVANELLFLQNYNPLTPHYGLPDIVPEIQTIVGDLAARRYNSRFFENDGVPRFVVAVEGGELTERAFETLTENLRELSKEENTHRGMLIEAVDAVQTQDEANDVSVDIHPLTVGEQEDASFIDFRKENEHDILKAHGVPPVVASRTEDSNYANSREQRQEFAQETILPRQKTLAARIYRSLHAVMLGAPGVALDFELHGGQNKKRQAEISQTRLNAGGLAMTVNEWREELGYPPMTTENGEPDPLGEMLMAELQGMGAMGSGGSSPTPSDPTDTGAPTDDFPVQGPGPGPGPRPDSTPAESTSPYEIVADGDREVTPSTEDDMDVNITINASDAADESTTRELQSDIPNRQRERAATSKYAQFEQGDMVSYGSGDQQNGLVLEVFTGSFEWPVDDEETEEVDADQDEPVYIVARAAGGSGVFAESELESSTFLDDVEANPSELADAEPAKIYDAMDDPNSLAEFRAARNVIENLNVPGVDDPEVGFAPGEPEGWTRLSFLKAWRSLGMTWTSCVAEMSGDVSRPKRWCAALKDTIYGTERWRNRF